jgi:uncharacterized protein (TIGR00730 family)
MALKRRRNRIFRTAKEELKHSISSKSYPQTESSAYQLAYTDQEFLLRKELRPIRLQLELLKAELIQQQAKIKSTVVIFGSARIPDTETSTKRLHALQGMLAKKPDDSQLKQAIKIAEKIAQKSQYYEEALRLAKLISRHGRDLEGNPLVVVTGGGPGIMEAANRGAHEVGAKNVGLNIVLPMEQGPNHYITPEFCFQFHYFAVRKMHFLIRAKALVVFPGGYGTLDELFEALTLLQTGKIARMPIILVGKKYWAALINFDFMVSEGVVDKEDLNLFTYAETAQEAWNVIEQFYGGSKTKES